MLLHARPRSRLARTLPSWYAIGSWTTWSPSIVFGGIARLTTSTPWRNDAELAPLRKQLKDEAKRKKKLARSDATLNRNQFPAKAAGPSEWELTVGIEVHAELNTAHKLFSQACTSINEDPNTHVARFDAALPGAQPQFQTPTLIPALRAALALNCDIQQRCTWDRKHYFYQDQPNGYQITQYYGL